MYKTTLFTATLMCLLFMVSCQQAPAPQAESPEAAKPDMAALKAEIQAINVNWAAAANARDTAAIMDLYADDIISMPADKPTIVGKAGVQKDSETWFEKAKEGTVISYETLEVYGDENRLTEIGKSTVKDASGKVIDSGKYMAIWEKRDGKWLCTREIGNDDSGEKK